MGNHSPGTATQPGSPSRLALAKRTGVAAWGGDSTGFGSIEQLLRHAMIAIRSAADSGRARGRAGRLAPFVARRSRASQDLLGLRSSPVRPGRDPRSTLVRDSRPPDAPATRGPKSSWTDARLTEFIQQVLAASPFVGEGYRKVWARLRRAKSRVLGHLLARLPRWRDAKLSQLLGSVRPLCSKVG